jgi:hypothetical protein
MTRRSRTALAVAAIPTALTVSLEFAGLIQPGNVGRAVSALPLGATAAWLFVRALRADVEGEVRPEPYAANRHA